MSQKVRVGLIGLGMIGNPMSKRILAAGYPLTVCDIRPEPVEEIVSKGAAKAKTAKEVAQVSDIVLTSLPSLAACEDVYLGSNGLLKGAREGEILVETSTVPPSMVRRFSDEAGKQGVAVIDAALQTKTNYHEGLFKLKANEIVAKGLVHVMVGGDADTLERARPILATFGNPIIHFGPVGSGEMIKVIGNAATHAVFVMLCEILGVGVKADVDAKLLLDYLGKIPSTSHFIENTIPHYMETGTGSMMLLEPCLKDAESILQLGREFSVPMLLQSITHDYYQMAQCFGAKDRPWDGEVLKLWESLIGRSIRDK